MSTSDVLRRWIAYPLEAFGARLIWRLFRLVPLDRASALGGWIGRMLGPRVGVSSRARRHLVQAFPEKQADEIERIIAGMWDNLGRVVGEYAHLPTLGAYDARDGRWPRIEVVGLEHLIALRDGGRPGILFSAHMANWEVLLMVAASMGLATTSVYRAANNPLVDALIQRWRGDQSGEFVPKGSQGARAALKALGSGRHLAMLVDQKMNDGIAVPFFGRPAMTAPALAELALRFNCPVVPARLERLDGAHLRLTVLPPLDLAPTGDRAADVLRIMTRVNALLEDWIRQRPEQWFWLHRRWPD
jgi:KDO2-lipid IV(A) lauroyltransferase